MIPFGDSILENFPFWVTILGPIWHQCYQYGKVSSPVFLLGNFELLPHFSNTLGYGYGTVDCCKASYSIGFGQTTVSQNSDAQLGQFNGTLNFNGRFDQFNRNIVIGFAFTVLSSLLTLIVSLSKFGLLALNGRSKRF